MSCDCNTPFGENTTYGSICRPDIPYPSVSHESVPSLIDNLVNALYGQINKNVVGGKVVWNIPCDPNNTAIVSPALPRLAGEGLLCYIMRVFQDFLSGGTDVFSPFYNWTYTGNGSTTSYALVNATYLNPAAYLVYIDGVVQTPRNYTIQSGTPYRIVFSTAIPNGYQVEIVCMGSVSGGTPDGINIYNSTFFTPTIYGATLSGNTNYENLAGEDITSSGSITCKTITASHINFSGTTFTGNSGPSTVVSTGSTTARTLQNRFADVVNVKDFGAVGDGVTDDTAAFSAACAAAPSNYVDQQAIDGNIPISPIAQVFVPNGKYLITSTVNVANKMIVWEASPEVYFVNSTESYLNGKINRGGNRINYVTTYGMRDEAGAFSVISNHPTHEAGVEGFSTPSSLCFYNSYDSVGFYAENHSVVPLANTSSTTYTLNSVTIGSAVDTKQLRVGMIVKSFDTSQGGQGWAGFVTGWDTNGLTINVNAWYRVDGGVGASPYATNTISENTYAINLVGTTDYTAIGSSNNNVGTVFIATGAMTGTGMAALIGKPANGSQCIVNVNSKIWALNANAFLDNNQTTAATGFELGTINTVSAPSGEGSNPKVWGYDSVNLGSFRNESAFIARGSWYKGFEVFDGSSVGFSFGNTTTPATGTGFRYNGIGSVIEAYNATNQQTFTLSSSGSIELGNQAVASSAFVDFHSSGKGSDYDTRIFSIGGNSTAGQGAITILASVIVAGSQLRPSVDNAYALGVPSYRWSTVYAATGTIITSDERAKTDIVDSNLGLDFIKALRPVSYKFKVGSNKVIRQVYRDSEGNEVDANAEGANPAEIITEEVAGSRNHYGLLAQEVKVALPEGTDFAGWILTDKNDPNSQQGLRYDQFISPIIKAIQEQQLQIKALQDQVASLTQKS
jgi:hypothetical protein